MRGVQRAHFVQSASAGSDSKTATSSDAANTIRITLLATTSLNNVPFDDSYDMADTSKATGKPSFEVTVSSSAKAGEVCWW